MRARDLDVAMVPYLRANLLATVWRQGGARHEAKEPGCSDGPQGWGWGVIWEKERKGLRPLMVLNIAWLFSWLL